MRGYTWPAPPHDPTERELVERIGDWEVRAFARTDARHAYLLRRGMGHLQIWHYRAGISLLTPSRMTGSEWELDLPGEVRRRFRLAPLDDIEDLLCARRLPLTPEIDLLRAAQARHVERPLRELLLLGGLGAPGQPIPCA